MRLQCEASNCSERSFDSQEVSSFEVSAPLRDSWRALACHGSKEERGQFPGYHETLGLFVGIPFSSYL